MGREYDPGSQLERDAMTQAQVIARENTRLRQRAEAAERRVAELEEAVRRLVSFVGAAMAAEGKAITLTQLETKNIRSALAAVRDLYREEA